MSAYVYVRTSGIAGTPFALLATTVAELESWARDLGVTAPRRIAGRLPFYDLDRVAAETARERGAEFVVGYRGLKALDSVERVDPIVVATMVGGGVS